ncbi:MAG: TraB/GumN family protein [Pseudomonadota bacterium]
MPPPILPEAIMIQIRQLNALLIALLLFSACGTPTPDSDSSGIERQAGDSPAFWTVSDEDTTVHLFGTVHALKPGTSWKTTEFDLAFDRLDALYLEADISTTDVQQQIAVVIGQEGLFTDGTILNDYLTPNEQLLVDLAAEIVGLSPESLENLRPWFVSRSLANLHIESLGYSISSGVDTVLFNDAKRKGIPRRYLENSEDIFRKLGALPDEETADMLAVTASDIVEDEGAVERLIASWKDGDVDRLGEFYNPEEGFGSEAVYDVMISNRNRAWIEQIDELMRTEEGTFMIAVGAGHFAGPDSLIRMLENRGLTPFRR